MRSEIVGLVTYLYLRSREFNYESKGLKQKYSSITV